MIERVKMLHLVKILIAVFVFKNPKFAICVTLG